MSKRLSVSVMVSGGGGKFYAEQSLEDAAKAIGLDIDEGSLTDLAGTLGLSVHAPAMPQRSPRINVIDSDDEEEEVGGVANSEGTGTAGPEAAGAAVGAGDGGARRMEGFLKKEGGRRKTVKKRWFTLDPEMRTILYSVDPTAPMLGSVPLLDVGVMAGGKKKHGYVLELFSLLGDTIKSSKRDGKEMKVGAHEQFVMYAEAEAERDAWVAAINRATIKEEDAAKLVADAKKEKVEKERDVKDIITVYSELDTQHRGVLSREEARLAMKACAVPTNITVAAVKMLDIHSTGLISLHRFIQAYRIGCWPVDVADGERCSMVMHRLVTALIKMGARKAKGQPYTLLELFKGYLIDHFSMDAAVAHEIGSELADNGKIYSLQYLNGVLGGIIPVTHEGAKGIAEIAEAYMQLAACAPGRDAGAAVPRSTFVQWLASRHPALGSEACGIIYDVVTLESGVNERRLRLAQYAAGVRVGLIPHGATGGAEADSRLAFVSSAFDVLAKSGQVSLEDLRAAIWATHGGPQATALACEADVDGSGQITRAEFVRLVFWYTLTPPQPPAPDGRTTAPASGQVRAAVPPLGVAAAAGPAADNHMRLADEVVPELGRLVAGKANVLQLKVDGERQMVTVGASLRCTVSEVADKLDQTEPSYVVINGRWMGSNVDVEDLTGAVMFLAVLPPTADAKQKMIYMLMKEVVQGRVEMAGMVFDVTKDVKDEGGLGADSLLELQKRSDLTIEDDDF